MSDGKNRVCPVESAGRLDNPLRRWLQNPQKILKPYLQQGMTVLEVGCGPGFFTLDIARMVGRSGQVIAADVQKGMLHKLQIKIQGTELEERITLHKCGEDKVGVQEHVDFILAFYMVHEIVNQREFFNELRLILKPNGHFLIVEPPFHVPRMAFEETIRKACDAGFIEVARPRVLLSKTVLLVPSSV